MTNSPESFANRNWYAKFFLSWQLFWMITSSGNRLMPSRLAELYTLCPSYRKSSQHVLNISTVIVFFFPKLDVHRHAQTYWCMFHPHISELDVEMNSQRKTWMYTNTNVWQYFLTDQKRELGCLLTRANQAEELFCMYIHQHQMGKNRLCHWKNFPQGISSSLKNQWIIEPNSNCWKCSYSLDLRHNPKLS